jgi:excisionase family DNA binding protein
VHTTKEPTLLRLDPDGPPLTAKEAAEHLRVSERSVRRWATDGELPGAYNFHGKWLFPQAVLIEFLRKAER